MSEFTPVFKKSVLEHGTLKLSRYNKEKKKLTSFSCVMSGAGVHFNQWGLDGGAPLRVRFDLLSVNLISSFIKKAITSKEPVMYEIECDAKPRDKDKFHEGTLVIRKDNNGLICIGIAKPGTPSVQAETFPIIPSYFLRFKQSVDGSNSSNISNQEICYMFANTYASTLISMAQSVAVIDYVPPPSKDGNNQSNNRQSTNSNKNYQQTQQPSSNFDNEFDEDFE